MIKKLSAYKTYLIFSGATAALFSMVFTVSMVYQVEAVHLNPLQLILVGTVLETASFIFEIPIFNAWLNNHIEDSARATVLSTNGQLNSLGQILGGPIIGVIAAKISISTGIACASLLVTPVIVLYLISMIKDRKNSAKLDGSEVNVYENN